MQLNLRMWQQQPYNSMPLCAEPWMLQGCDSASRRDVNSAVAARCAHQRW